MFKNCKKYCAELIGTAILVFMACGIAVYVGTLGTDPAWLLVTALGFGLVIVAMAYTIGSISGCHINPAVSLGALINKKITFKEFCCYVGAQVIGGIIGGALLFMIYQLLGGTGFAEGAMGENLYTGGLLASLTTAKAIALAIIVEVILTFIFVFTILGVTSKSENSKVAGLVIGLTLTLVHLLGIAFTGTSVNPARSIGSAVFAGVEALEQVWLFIVAPLVGAVIAGFAAKFLFSDETADKPQTITQPKNQKSK